MGDVKVLPRGIPAGNIPNTQRVRDTKVRLTVSDETRRWAHELDQTRSDWLRIKEKDELYELNHSPFENPMNHTEWLTDFFNADDRYAAVVERRLWLQQKLSEMKRTRKVDGLARHKKQFLTHQAATRLELTYVQLLQGRMRSTRKKSLAGAQGRLYQAAPLHEIANEIASDAKSGEMLKTLTRLQAEASIFINHMKINELVPDELRAAIEDARTIIRVYSMMPKDN